MGRIGFTRKQLASEGRPKADPVYGGPIGGHTGVTSFARFLDDGRICLTNNAAERALRGIALGRKSWLFAGFDRGGERAR